MDSDQVDIKGGESYPDILDKVRDILNKEWILMDSIAEFISITFSKQGGLMLLEKLPIILAGVCVGIVAQKVRRWLGRWYRNLERGIKIMLTWNIQKKI